ncbi:hypothetical protein BX070DRAFT_221327 [Coemansia spiralis]|nr:hypothetical protein BX070DRAFT_221327 [Coemansia spiralis]
MIAHRIQGTRKVEWFYAWKDEHCAPFSGTTSAFSYHKTAIIFSFFFFPLYIRELNSSFIDL